MNVEPRPCKVKRGCERSKTAKQSNTEERKQQNITEQKFEIYQFRKPKQPLVNRVFTSSTVRHETQIKRVASIRPIQQIQDIRLRKRD